MINRRKVIKNVISTAIMVIAIIALIVVYSKYNYNDFIKSVVERDKTSFTRDHEIRCSKMDSYKIENKDYNDAMFFEAVSVTPNVPYKVTCKVKVQDVENENNTNKRGSSYMHCWWF